MNRAAGRLMPWIVLGLVLALLGWRRADAAVQRAAPRASLAYQRDLIRETRVVWGLDAPVAVMAGQIEQESHWRPRVCSAFACGLTQFTAATARTISAQHRAALGQAAVYNPEWAIRALALYDHDLWGQVGPAATPCDRWAFTLSAYNGGLGWIPRDRALCRAHAGCDPSRWWANVERYSRRAPKYTRENRGYPRIILLTNQAHYATWGPGVACGRGG